MNQGLAILNELKTTFNQRLYSIRKSPTLLDVKDSGVGFFETLDLRDYRTDVFTSDDFMHIYIYTKNDQYRIYTEVLAALLHRFFWEYGYYIKEYPYIPEKVLVVAREYIYTLKGNEFKLDNEYVSIAKDNINNSNEEFPEKLKKFAESLCKSDNLVSIWIYNVSINQFLKSTIEAKKETSHKKSLPYFLTNGIYYLVTEEYSCLYLNCSLANSSQILNR